MDKPALLIDLDGTIYKGNQIIDGALDLLAAIRELGIAHLFVTNRGNRTPESVASSLRSMGLECKAEHILTSAMATADHLEPGSTAYWVGEQGLDEAMNGAGILFNDENPDVVIAGYDREINYAKLTLATRLILKGARFIATNDDRLITVENGLIPEAGPIVAAIKNATSVEPFIIGKPHSTIVDSARRRLQVEADQCIIIGDNLSTDILTGVNHGLLSALVLTGVTTPDVLKNSPVRPTWTVKNLREFIQLLLKEMS